MARAQSTMKRIRIRRCRPCDVTAVLQFWNRAGAPESVTDAPSSLRARLRRDRDLLLLAWDDSRLIGSVMGGWDGWRASMARLAVDPAYRRLGIARALVARVEKRLRARGAKRIGGIVLIENRLGRAFWERAGYRRDRRVYRYIKDLAGARD
ncbi:MAG TPA: GNAT family N-acetyltransferase [Candidatus Binatia bacterium]|nr:GNAT family N-acetyltransferase [Candidatus Binatia bacterium]